MKLREGMRGKCKDWNPSVCEKLVKRLNHCDEDFLVNEIPIREICAKSCNPNCVN